MGTEPSTFDKLRHFTFFLTYKIMKKLSICLASIAMILATGCESLDIDPSDSYSEDMVWEEENLIRMYVNEQYNALVGQNDFYHYPYFSDEAYNKHNNDGCNYIRENILTSDNVSSVGSILNFWDSGYSYLHNINVFFEKIESADVSEDFKNTMIGEIKFIRAFIYFRLINSYGGVPIIETVYDTQSDWSNVKRNTYDECVEYILKDLEDVISTLPDKPEVRNRASANAARALKSRVLLYYASPLHNPDNDLQRWEAAAEAAEDLFDKGYALSSDYRSMFFNVDNGEYIFAKEFSETYYHSMGFNLACTGDGGFGQMTPSQNIVDQYETTDGQIPVLDSETGEVNPNSIYDPANPYANRDPRFYATIYYNGSTTTGGRTVETFTGGADMLSQDMTMTGYYFRKLLNENDEIGRYNHYTTPWPFFRLAEIYLNYAEAEYHLGNEDVAREYVNKVRARESVNMPPITETGEDLLNRIYHERLIELAFEGHRFFDKRRWMIPDNNPIIGMNITKTSDGSFTYERAVLSLDSRENDWTDAFYLLPIPFTEIQKSYGSIEQNPGYAQ